MKNKNKSAKRKQRNQKSMKGKWGKVGAPPKTTKFPKGVFTIESIHNRNKNQCKLSIRKKVEAAVDAGTLVRLKTRKQAHGAVGRPSAAYILKENFDSSKHEKGSAPAPLQRKSHRTTVRASVEPVAPSIPLVEATVNEPVAAIITAPEVTAPAVPEVTAQTEPPVNLIPAPTVAPDLESQAPVLEQAA